MKIQTMLKKITQNFVRTVQKILIVVSLIFIYFFGFGITLLFTLIFHRKVLTGYSKDDNTFWVEAERYEPDISDSLRQS